VCVCVCVCVIFYDKGVSCDYLNFEGTMVTQFVEGWDFVQTLGEGAYGEYVLLYLLISY